MLTFFGYTYSILYVVLFSALLIFGLIQCKKHAFTGGFYFFLFLIIGKIYSFLFSYSISPIIKNYMDSIDQMSERPLGMTTGELVAWISYAHQSITSILEITAFSFLVLGLYRMRQSKV